MKKILSLVLFFAAFIAQASEQGKEGLLFSGKDYSFAIVSLDVKHAGTKSLVTLKVHYSVSLERCYYLLVNGEAPAPHSFPEDSALATVRFPGGPKTNKRGWSSTMPENPITIAFEVDAAANRLWFTLWRSWGPDTPSGNFIQRAVVGLDSQVLSSERLYKDM